MTHQPREYGLDDFATRSFRNIADQDYIAARLAFRARLFPQFLWSSQQALEKYLKAILLFNRIKAAKVKHSLRRALDRCREADFDIELSDRSRTFLSFIDGSGERARYLDFAYYVETEHLGALDHCVWELRRHCQKRFRLAREDGKREVVPGFMEGRIKGSKKKPYHTYKIRNGLLESIIENSGHPSRPPLVWQNLYFGSRVRKTVRHPLVFRSENPTLVLHAPHLLDEVQEYVFLPPNRSQSLSATDRRNESVTEGQRGQHCLIDPERINYHGSTDTGTNHLTRAERINAPRQAYELRVTSYELRATSYELRREEEEAAPERRPPPLRLLRVSQGERSARSGYNLL